MKFPRSLPDFLHKFSDPNGREVFINQSDPPEKKLNSALGMGIVSILTSDISRSLVCFRKSRFELFSLLKALVFWK